MQTQFYQYSSFVLNQLATSASLFTPKVLGALSALTLGAIVAKIIRGILIRVLQSLHFSKLINQTPLQLTLEDQEIGKKAEEFVANLVYWLVMLVVIHTTVTILGLNSLTLVLERILSYIPRIISAIVVLTFGILLAGWLEGLVKKSVRRIDAKGALLLGKISSYLVMGIAILTSLSELGIASQFITILFIGFISALSLGFGLALGLGGKELVNQSLTNWYHHNFDPVEEDNKKKSTK